MTSTRPIHRGAGLAAGLTAAMLALAPQAAAQEPVRFAIQAWPGVTVKTEVATQLLDAMGYSTEVLELEPQFVYQGIRTGDVDVSLGAWMPAHEDMLQPLLDDGSAVQYAANLEGAIQGLAVPAYTYENGVQSVADLDSNGDRFNREIYAIGAGAAMTRAFEDAVENDYMGMGDWDVVPSSTAGMLSQVQRATDRGDAIVFHGWRPHWMDVVYDIRFLEPGPEGSIAGMETTVYTVVAAGWPEQHPQVARFLEQFKVDPDAQSRWIEGFSRQERDPGAVAEEWIRANLDQVEPWLEGVQTADGRPAAEAVRAKFSGGQ